jgi:hypothetical protein
MIFSGDELERLRDGSPTRTQELRDEAISFVSLDRLLEIEEALDDEIEEELLWDQLNWGRE